MIASFNQVEFIVEAVASLAHQVDEVVVVDDCSTDGSADAVVGIGLANVRVLRNEVQRGVSYSFNRAVAATQADVLLIQGGDDRSLDGRAAEQSGILADPGVSLVHSAPHVIDVAGNRLPPDLAAEFLAKPEDADPLSFLFFSSNYICAPAAAVRRADYERLGGFPLGIDLLQDYALWLQLAAVGRVVDSGSPVVEYRKHGTNTSREYVGLDAPKQRRLSAEMEFVRDSFVSHADTGTLTSLALHSALDLDRFATLDREQQVATIQLAHPNRLVVRRGLATLFAMLATPSGEERLAAMGLTPRDLGRFSLLADHDNLEDVGRALSVVTAITDLSVRNQNPAGR